MSKKDSIQEAVERTLDLKFKKKVDRIISDAVEQASNEKDLASKVLQKINIGIEKVILANLGLRYSFGRVELISKNVPVYNLLKKKASKDMEKFENELIEALPNIAITSEIAKVCADAYEKEFKRLMLDKVKRSAKENVEKFFADTFAKAIDFNNSPEAETVHSLRLTLEKTTDPATVKVLKEAIDSLEAKALERLDDAD